jgi:hypothetical protein
MTRHTTFKVFVAVLLGASLVSCDKSPTVSANPVSPTPPATSPAPSQPVIGEWHGSSRVESAKTMPDCTANFWEVGVSDRISIELLKEPRYSPDQYDLHLLQQASREFCHLDARITGSAIIARPWDEISGFESEWCHFRLDTSQWGCRGAGPEVWILGIRFTGSFNDESEELIQGSMEVQYDHRPGNSAPGTHYTTGTVTKSFEASKVSR